MRPVVRVSCGGEFSVMVDCKGAVYTFGCPEYGQLGEASIMVAPLLLLLSFLRQPEHWDTQPHARFALLLTGFGKLKTRSFVLPKIGPKNMF